jgi:putative aminopeptidase FrvX
VTTTTVPTFPPELLDLLAVPGVSGYEGPVVGLVRSRLPAGCTPREDALLNLTVSFGRGSPHLLVIVHTDEVGFVVSGVRSDGAVYLTPVGTWDLAALGGSQVEIHTPAGAVPAVVITVPPHLDKGLAGAGAWIEGQQIVVDVGADDAAATAALGIEVLQSATLARATAVLPGGYLVSRALDNRFGCHLLLGVARTLAATPPSRGTVTLAWSSQEEIGFRGPRALAHDGRYDAVLAVDAYPADRRVHARLADDAVRLGRGPVVRGVDLTGVGSMPFAKGILRLARERRLPTQPAYAAGHNQASVFLPTAAAALDLPIGYLHSGAECLHADDLETISALLAAIVTHPDPETLWS